MQAKLVERSQNYHLARDKKEDPSVKEKQKKLLELDAKIDNLLFSLESVSNI